MVSSLAVKETQFDEQFREFIETANDDLRRFREQAFRYFGENGFPSVRNEDWKYTNVAPIAKENWRVANGDRELSSFSEIKGPIEGFNFRRNGFTALNAAFAQPIVYRIPRETVVEQPIE